MAPFRRLAVVGVGLIGGSVALALRRAGACREFVAAGRDPGNLRRAVELGIVDRACASATRSRIPRSRT